MNECPVLADRVTNMKQLTAPGNTAIDASFVATRTTELLVTWALRQHEIEW